MKSENTLRTEVGKLNDKLLNLNSEIMSTRSMLKKTEDEHEITKKQLKDSFSGMFPSPHIFLEGEQAALLTGEHDESVSEKSENDEILVEHYESNIADQIMIDQLQAEKEKLENENEQYRNRIQTLMIEVETQKLSKKLGLSEELDSRHGSLKSNLTKYQSKEMHQPAFDSVNSEDEDVHSN